MNNILYSAQKDSVFASIRFRSGLKVTTTLVTSISVTVEQKRILYTTTTIMEPYYQLIHNTKLYPKEATEAFEPSIHGYHLMTNRQKEREMCKIMCCLLVCNGTPLVKSDDEMGDTSRGKKRAKIQSSTPKKKPKISNEPRTGTSTDPPESIYTSSSSTSGNDCTIDEGNLSFGIYPTKQYLEQYRFHLIKANINSIQLMTYFYERLKIPKLPKQWDIVDLGKQYLIDIVLTTR